MDLIVKMNIPTGAAVRAGLARAGEIDVSLTEAFLATLDPDEREVLTSFARLPRAEANRWNTLEADPREPRANEAGLLAALRQEMENRLTRAKEKKAQEEAEARAFEAETRELIARMPTDPDFFIYDKGWGEPRFYARDLDRGSVPEFKAAIETYILPVVRERTRAHEEEKARQEAEAKEAKARAEAEAKEAERLAALRPEALTVMITEHGTDNQRARHARGVLPEKEALTVVRGVIFQPLDDVFPRYVKIKGEDIRPSCRCKGEGSLCFDVAEVKEMDADLWENVRRFEEQVAAKTPEITVELKQHHGYCVHKKCPHGLVRYSALATLNWFGLELSREYSLDGEAVVEVANDSNADDAE
jgi:hypothetical protein